MDSDALWTRYAEGHKGIVLRIAPNVADDSKFQKFAPVVYRDARPPLFNSAVDFLEDALFGDRDARCKVRWTKLFIPRPENGNSKTSIGWSSGLVTVRKTGMSYHIIQMK
jgi:hypothetical protein